MLGKAFLTSLCVLALAGCGGGFSPGEDELVVYSGREEELVGPLIERFEEETGIEVAVRYANSSELAATLAEEGGNSPADVFWAQDPGALGAVEAEGRFAELPQRVLDRVPERFRDPDGTWTGVSGRVRVIAYNTDDVPESVMAAMAPATSPNSTPKLAAIGMTWLSEPASSSASPLPNRTAVVSWSPACAAVMFSLP